MDTLASSGPDDHHVMVNIDEDQKMSFEGGDGRFGAKFPTGLNNISARYRQGLGIAANLDAQHDHGDGRAAGILAVEPQPRREFRRG